MLRPSGEAMQALPSGRDFEIVDQEDFPVWRI
jgi:hypothetical protein